MRKPYAPPTLRPITNPEEIAKLDEAFGRRESGPMRKEASMAMTPNEIVSLATQSNIDRAALHLAIAEAEEKNPLDETVSLNAMRVLNVILEDAENAMRSIRPATDIRK